MEKQLSNCFVLIASNDTLNDIIKVGGEVGLSNPCLRTFLIKSGKVDFDHRVFFKYLLNLRIL